MSQPRTVLITGCSVNGLGDHLARAFHAKGLRVIATARTPSKMAHLKSMDIETLALDVTSPESCSNCVDAVTNLTGGTLDILVNNAGGGYVMPMMDVDIEKGKQLYETNVWGLLRVTQAFLPLLMNSKYAGGGMVVNHSSIVSVLNNPLQGAYNSSKAAAAMISDTMRLELNPLGINVIDLKTAAVASEFYANQPTGPSPRLPENSIYLPARETIEKIMIEGPPRMKFMPQPIWAESVVKDLLKSSPPLAIWKGAHATVAWILSAVVPHSWRDWFLLGMNSFGVITRSLHHMKRQ